MARTGPRRLGFFTRLLDQTTAGDLASKFLDENRRLDLRAGAKRGFVPQQQVLCDVRSRLP